MAVAILDSHLPPDLVDDISLRIHNLHMSDLLGDIRNPRRILDLHTPIKYEDWFEFVSDYVRLVCILSDGGLVHLSHTYFTQEVRKVIYMSQSCDIIVGQMDYGAWFVHHSNMFEDYVVMVNDIDLLLKELPDQVKEDLSLVTCFPT